MCAFETMGRKMANLSKMRAKKKAWAEWTPEKAAGLPYGVPDNLELVGGIGKKTNIELAKEGITTLTALSMLADDEIAGLEERTGIMKGRILREEWVEQARELLEGLPPRAKTDLPLWTRRQKEAEALAAAAPPVPVPEPEPVATPEPEPEPVAVFEPEPVVEEEVYVEPVAFAASVGGYAIPESKDHLKIGILTAIPMAIAFMFFLGWWFGKEERERLANGGAINCPPGQYPVVELKKD